MSAGWWTWKISITCAQARAHGKGVIIVTTHFGNWELGGSIMTALGYRLSAVFQPERAHSVNRLFQQHRAGRGIHGIAWARRRSVIQVLKNRTSGRHAGRRPRFQPPPRAHQFFGAPAPAQQAGAPGDCTSCPSAAHLHSRKPDDRFLMRCYSPLMPADCQSLDELRQRIRDILQEEIRQNPLQWFMFEDFGERKKDDHADNPRGQQRCCVSGGSLHGRTAHRRRWCAASGGMSPILSSWAANSSVHRRGSRGSRLPR